MGIVGLVVMVEAGWWMLRRGGGGWCCWGMGTTAGRWFIKRTVVVSKEDGGDSFAREGCARPKSTLLPLVSLPVATRTTQRPVRIPWK